VPRLSHAAAVTGLAAANLYIVAFAISWGAVMWVLLGEMFPQPDARIVMFPWRGTVARAIQYQVVVAVVRFDGRPDGDITLDTRWRILGRDGDELAFRRSTVVEAAAGPGYERMVAAMARALVALGREMGAEIGAMPEGTRR
jgi:uncharacterized lipoprotein YmbA